MSMLNVVVVVVDTAGPACCPAGVIGLSTACRYRTWCPSELPQAAPAGPVDWRGALATFYRAHGLHDKLASADPLVWDIDPRDGRLLLFCSWEMKAEWEKDVDAARQKADERFAGLCAKASQAA